LCCFYRELIRDFALAGDLFGFGDDRFAFVIRPNWSFKRDGAVLADDFDVMSVGGERLIGDDGFADLLSQVPIVVIFLLGSSGYRRVRSILLIGSRVVRLSLSRQDRRQAEGQDSGYCECRKCMFA